VHVNVTMTFHVINPGNGKHPIGYFSEKNFMKKYEGNNMKKREGNIKKYVEIGRSMKEI